MKKLISMLLIIAMLMSIVPTISFAENDAVITEATEQQTELTAEEEQYIGNTVNLGNDMYSLQDGEVYVSKNYGRDTKLAEGEITWLVEDNGIVYWSKLGEHNTTDIVKYDPVTGEESVLVHLFVPVEAFDVAGDEVYYLYNGEIVKNNITTGNEEIVMVNKKVNRFYIDVNGGISALNSNIKSFDNYNYDVELLSSIVDINDPSVFLKQPKGSKTCTFYSNLMMFRRGALLNQNTNWTSFTEENYRAKWWSGGMAWEPSGEGMKAKTYGKEFRAQYPLGDKDKRLEFFKEKLREHKEGIVIYVYSSASEHAILLTDYNSQQDVFFCADPAGDKKGRIKLSESTLKKYVNDAGYTKPEDWSDQEYILAYVMQYWQMESGVQACGNCLEPGSNKYETYNGELGACRICHQPYNYDAKQYTDNTGVWKKKLLYTGKTITLKEKPYADARSLGIADTFIPVVHHVKNAYGNTWYATFTQDKSGDYVRAYFYLDDKITKYLSKVENASLAIPDIKEESVVYPSTSNGGTQKTTTTNTSKTNSVVSKNISVNWTKFPEQINVGDSYGLRGTISSNYPIYYVSAMLLDESGNGVIPNIDFSAGGVKTINITASQIINAKMYFNRIKTGGNYRVRIIVNCNSNGSQDGIWYQDYWFTVKGNESPAPEPTISSQNIEEGQRAVLNCNDGMTVHYKVNGGNEETCSNGKTLDFKTEGSYNIEAWTTGSGYASSPHIYKTIGVSKVKTPIIGDVVYGEDEATVAITGTGTINYTMDGSTPTKDSGKYKRVITLHNNTTIKALASQYGKQNSDIASKTLTVSKPDVPSGLKLLNTKEKIAQGRTATVEWNSAERVASYTAKLYYNGEYAGKYETRGTKASFDLTNVGTYTIKVSATNSIGTSAESTAVTVESMAPVTVTFVDKILRTDTVTDSVVEQIQENINAKYKKVGKENPPQIENNVLCVQTIDYDTKPSVPLWEDKPGLSRQRWSDNSTKEVTEDTTIYGYYSVRSYGVQFWNVWTYGGIYEKKLGATQTVMYSFSAEPPEVTELPIGHILSGWQVDSSVSSCFDFTFVDGNMRLNTVYTWENMDLPTIVQITGARRANTCTSYSVDIKYINNNLYDTQARAIMTLYTSDGKVVETSITDVDLPKTPTGKYDTATLQTMYDDKISKISVVLVRVENGKTGGAISKMVSTSNIQFPNADTYLTSWSSWSETHPGDQAGFDSNGIKGIKRHSQSKPQYRYRNKEYTTSSASSLSGWAKYDTKRTSWGGTKGPVYSNPQNDSRNVWSERYVTSSNYKTIYHYFRYAKSWSGGYGSTRASDYPNYYEYTFDYELPRYTGNYGYKWHWGSGSGDWNTVWRCDYIGKPYTTQQWVSDNYGTRWYYQEPIYTYYYWKWGNWSNWSDTWCAGDETGQRTVYRYRDEFNVFDGYDFSKDSQFEEETKKTYRFEGNIPGLEKDYKGKVATVLVYKKTNTDPTQDQLEYVDQITLGENNAYSFIVNPKDEIHHTDTGDYIVTLSIEGCEKLATIDIIKAPLPQVEVTFCDDNGTILKDANGKDMVIKVDEGGSIDADDIPAPLKDGHRFLKWNTSLINITSDIIVYPIYEKELYNVVFVDYENKTAEMVEMYYGDHAGTPDVADVEGMKFVGWDLQSYQFSADGDVDTDVFGVKEDIPYYKTVDGDYILSTEYDTDVHTIIDETEYYKYISETNSIITKSKIITAIWEPIEYKVTFYDFEGNVVSEQDVKHGEAATPPEYVEKDGVLYGWDLTGEEWWNVTKDMSIHPCVPHTIDAPTVSEPTNNGYGTFTTELETTVESGKIYYSVDFEITEKDAKLFVDGKSSEENSEEQTETVSLMSTTTMDEDNETESNEETYLTIDNMIKEYSEPIELYAGSVVYAFTVDAEGNISPVSVFQYDSDDNVDLGLAPNEYTPDLDTPQITMPTICAKPGQTVTIPVSIKNNMGINYLEIILGYDTDSLTLENIANGDVFDYSGFSSDTREDGSCKFIWQSEGDNFNDGTLMNLTFKVNDTATESKYLLDLSVEYSGDENEEEWYFVTVPGAITDEEQIVGLLGDVNSDNEVDFADAIQILKFDAGFIEFEDNQLVVGDVNGDEEVDFADAIQILKFDAGLIEEFSR